MAEGIFAVERETRTAGNERVVATAEGVYVLVAESGRRNAYAWNISSGNHWQSLLRHAHKFDPLYQDNLRVESVVAFKQSAIPGGILRADRERAVGRIRRRTGRQVFVIGTTEVHSGDVILLYVNLADQTGAVKAPVANTGARQTEGGIPGDPGVVAVGKLKICGSLSEISECTDALEPETSDLKGLADRKKSIVAAAGRQIGGTVI